MLEDPKNLSIKCHEGEVGGASFFFFSFFLSVGKTEGFSLVFERVSKKKGICFKSGYERREESGFRGKGWFSFCLFGKRLGGASQGFAFRGFKGAQVVVSQEAWSLFIFIFGFLFPLAEGWKSVLYFCFLIWMLEICILHPTFIK